MKGEWSGGGGCRGGHLQTVIVGQRHKSRADAAGSGGIEFSIIEGGKALSAERGFLVSRAMPVWTAGSGHGAVNAKRELKH